MTPSRTGGRLIYIGAGTSGRLGCLDAAECLPTFGVSVRNRVRDYGGRGARAFACRRGRGGRRATPVHSRHRPRFRVNENDVVCGISASGGAPYVIAALQEATRRGAVTVAVANSPDPPIGRAVAEIAIVAVTGAEVITGSTRLKAGTAQKLILNMITTGAMVRIGKTYGNRMVDVASTNVKLVARSRRSGAGNWARGLSDDRCRCPP